MLALCLCCAKLSIAFRSSWNILGKLKAQAIAWPGNGISTILQP